MPDQLTRPRVEELVFHLYTRPIHPELFDTLAMRRIERGGYILTVYITPLGHVLSWHAPRVHLTEIIAPEGYELPREGRVLQHRFQGEHSGQLPVIAGIRYQVCTQLETLPAEIFLHVHEEMLADSRKRGLIYAYPPQHRLGLSPLGYMTVTETRNCLSVAAFHTFPESLAVIKTQSLIERVSETAR